MSTQVILLVVSCSGSFLVLGLKETSAVTSDMECPYWKAYFNAKLWKHTTLSSRHVLVFDKVGFVVYCFVKVVEPRHEKTCLRGLRPDKTKAGLRSQRLARGLKFPP